MKAPDVPLEPTPEPWLPLWHWDEPCARELLLKAAAFQGSSQEKQQFQ